MNKFQGKFPVIFIDLKDTKEDSFENIFKLVRDQVRKSFLQHKYLLNSNILSNNDKLEIN